MLFTKRFLCLPKSFRRLLVWRVIFQVALDLKDLHSLMYLDSNFVDFFPGFCRPCWDRMDRARWALPRQPTSSRDLKYSDNYCWPQLTCIRNPTTTKNRDLSPPFGKIDAFVITEFESDEADGTFVLNSTPDSMMRLPQYQQTHCQENCTFPNTLDKNLLSR